jgi:hypothetical protein
MECLLGSRTPLSLSQPVERDGPGGRHVERVHLGRHRNADLEIGRREGLFAEPAALGAEE